MKNLLLFSVLGAFALSATGIDAATVSAAGTLTGLTPPGWGTGNDNADLDAAGAGADGFVLFNSIPEPGSALLLAAAGLLAATRRRRN